MTDLLKTAVAYCHRCNSEHDPTCDVAPADEDTLTRIEELTEELRVQRTVMRQNEAAAARAFARLVDTVRVAESVRDDARAASQRDLDLRREAQEEAREAAVEIERLNHQLRGDGR